MHIVCPHCGGTAVVKYMPLIQVPVYAQFQPLEKLAICMKCGKKGKIGKTEMRPKQNTNLIKPMWTWEEIEEWK